MTSREVAAEREMLVPRERVPVLSVAEWVESRRDGAFSLLRAAGADSIAAANRAPCYEERSYVAATGSMRRIDFLPGAEQTVCNLSGNEALVLLDGVGRIEASAGSHRLTPGAAVAYPEGLFRNEGAATLLLWRIRPDPPGVRPMATMEQAQSLHSETLEWMEAGKRVVVPVADACDRAPEGAIELELWRYDFDGFSIGIAQGKRGGPTFEYTSDYDQLLYITEGSYRFFQDDVEVEVQAGDLVREIAGHYHHWIRHEDSGFVGVTSGPLE